MSQKLLYQKSSSSGNIGSSSSSKSSLSSSGQKMGGSSFKSSTSIMKEKSKSSGSQERSGSPYASIANTEQFMKVVKSFQIPKISKNNGGSSSSGVGGLSNSPSSQKLSSGNISNKTPLSKDESKTSSMSSQQKSSQYNFSSAPTTPVSNLNSSPENSKAGGYQGNSAMPVKRPSSTIPGSSSSSSFSSSNDKTKKLIKSSSSEQLFVNKPKKIKESGNLPSDSSKMSQEDVLNSLARSGVQASLTTPSLSNHMSVLNDLFKQQQQQQKKIEVRNEERRTPTSEFNAKQSVQRIQNFSPTPQLFSSPSPQNQPSQQMSQQSASVAQQQSRMSPTSGNLKPQPMQQQISISLYSDDEILDDALLGSKI